MSLFTIAIEHYFVGLNPFLYHFNNILLHLINIYLVFLLVKNLSGNINISLVVTILFAINPIHVQTVAQAAERRGLLMAIFYLISLLSYLKYLRNGKNNSYFFAILFFILSLFSNGRAIPLSVSIIAIDLFYKRKIFSRKVILEKIPFLFIAIVFGLINIKAQQLSGYAYHHESFSKIDYTLIAGYSYIKYIINLIFPFNLSSGYPYPDIINNHLPYAYYFFSIITIGIIIFLISRLKKFNLLVLGLTFYSLNIVLLLRLFSPLTENIMEDHYMYIPSIGIYLIIVSFLEKLTKKKSKSLQVSLSVLLVLITLLSCTLTFQRNKIWQTSMFLFNDILDKQPNRIIPRNNRGFLYLYDEKYSQALNDFNKVIEIDPLYFESYYGRARVYQDLGKNQQALQDYDFYISTALNITNNYKKLAAAYNNRGVIYIQERKYKSAYRDFNESIKFNPEYVDAYNNLALIHLTYKNPQKALEYNSKAIKINSEDQYTLQIQKLIRDELSNCND